MRFAAALLALALARFALPALAAGEASTQSVTPIEPRVEQRIEPITPPGEQQVEALDADGVQRVTAGRKNSVRRTVDAATKVVVGVTAFAVAVGATVASLLLV